MTHNLNPARCESCEGKGIPENLRPYCSIVCRLLACAGLGWRSEPCRVVDLETGLVLSAGPEFNFTGAGIGELQRRAAHLRVSASEPVLSHPYLLTTSSLPSIVSVELTTCGGGLEKIVMNNFAADASNRREAIGTRGGNE